MVSEGSKTPGPHHELSPLGGKFKIPTSIHTLLLYAKFFLPLPPPPPPPPQIHGQAALKSYRIIRKIE